MTLSDMEISMPGIERQSKREQEAGSLSPPRAAVKCEPNLSSYKTQAWKATQEGLHPDNAAAMLYRDDKTFVVTDADQPE